MEVELLGVFARRNLIQANLETPLVLIQMSLNRQEGGVDAYAAVEVVVVVAAAAEVAVVVALVAALAADFEQVPI